MLNRDLSLLKALEAKGIDVFYLEEWAEVRLEELPESTHTYSWEHDIFYAWFVLQHFRGYIPFITRVSNSHNVSFLKQLR